MNTASAVLTLGGWWLSLRWTDVLEERQRVAIRVTSGLLLLASVVLASAIPLITNDMRFREAGRAGGGCVEAGARG